MNVTIIKTKAQHRKALARMEELWGAERGTDEGNQLDLLMLVVEAYERTKLEPAPPHPIEAIEFRMEQLGIDSASALAELVELSRGRVSELLNRKRALTLDHIRRFRRLGVPADVLIADYELNRPGGLHDTTNG